MLAHSRLTLRQFGKSTQNQKGVHLKNFNKNSMPSLLDSNYFKHILKLTKTFKIS